MNFTKSFEVSAEMKSIFPTQRDRKPTKNFLVENIRNIRTMKLHMDEGRNAVRHKSGDLQEKNKRLPFTTTKPWTRYVPTAEKSLSSTTVTSEQYLRKTSRSTQVESVVSLVSRSVQTSPSRTNDSEDVVESSKLVKSPTDVNKRVVAPRVVTNSRFETSKERALNNILKGTFVNFVEQNRRAEYKPKTIRKVKTDPTAIPPNYQLGELPRYLQDRKKNDIVEEVPLESSADIEQLIPSSPASEEHSGHIALTDAERVEHLRMINKRYNELMLEYNQLPVRSDSLKARQKRSEIENKLDSLEKSMKIFSRDKLYIKI